MSRRLFTASIVAAVAFGPAAHAAVVITVLPDPLFLRDEFFGSYHPVDVDGNGSTDFTFGYNPGFVGLRTEAANRVIFSPDPPPNLGGPVASLSHGFLVQSTFDSSTFSWRSSDLLGGFVSPGENAFASIVHALSTGSSTDFNGRGYIGVEFESTLGTHYGYLDIEAGPGFDGITFYGWAYETQPGVPIFAGQVPEPSALILAGVSTAFLLSRRRRKLRPENKTLLDNRWGGFVCGASSSLGVFPASHTPPHPICARARRSKKHEDYTANNFAPDVHWMRTSACTRS